MLAAYQMKPFFDLFFPHLGIVFASVQIFQAAFFVFFSGGLEYVSHSFAYVVLFEFLRDVWIRDCLVESFIRQEKAWSIL